MKKINLFCLPYAGGSAMTYKSWVKYLNSMIELQPVELRGRGKRFSEPFYADFNHAIDDLYLSIKDRLNGSEYAFFGHSLGSVLAYELVNKIKAEKYREPVHIFFSGRYPPHIRKNEKDYLLPDDEFKTVILKYGGTAKEILENREMLKVFMPIIRADYKILDDYECAKNPEKLECSISILNGLNDEEVMKYDVNEWRQYTTKRCNFFEFDGGHFFINEKVEEVVRIINNTLSNHIAY